MVVTNSAVLPIDLEKAVKMGEGKYREVFRLDNFALKILKTHINKNYCFFSVNFNADLYTKRKFGIEDFNQYEYYMFRDFIERVPYEFKDRFAQIHSTGRINGRSYSLSDLVVNCDGSLSKSLAQNRGLEDENFWEQIEELENVLVREKIPIVDIRGENIMVREEDGYFSPVFIDFKRYSDRTYPAQFWLSSEKKLFEKIKRRFQRLKEQYKKN